MKFFAIGFAILAIVCLIAIFMGGVHHVFTFLICVAMAVICYYTYNEERKWQ